MLTNNEFILGFILAMSTIIGLAYLIANFMEKHSKPSRKSSKYTNLKGEQKPHTKESDNPRNDTSTKIQKPPEKDYSEIDIEIKEVTGWIGVSEPVDTSEMFKKVLDGKEKEVMNEIAKQLSLPMKITTKYCSEIKHNGDGLSPLAEVTIGNIPHYGSKYLKDYPCVITLYPGYNSRPDRFIYVIAHELCHYVLRSLRPRLSDSKKEERLTDLAVIFGGFESAYRTGWQSYIHGNAGYYADEFNIDYIRRQYENMLAVRKQKFEKIHTGYKELLREQSDILLFIKLCTLLLEHPDERIIQDDMEAINICFSLISKKEIEKIGKLRASLEPFLQKRTRYDEMTHSEEDLVELTRTLKGVSLPAAGEIAVLMKYTDKYVTHENGDIRAI